MGGTLRETIWSASLALSGHLLGRPWCSYDFVNPPFHHTLRPEIPMNTEEEMRQALRSLSGAKNRQREAEKLAKQEGSQARDLEERLKAGISCGFSHLSPPATDRRAMLRLATSAALLGLGAAMPWADSTCQAAPGCDALQLEGECCPNPEGVTLDCCQLAKCSSHPQCAALGLEGDCCPPADGTSLDCCDSDAIRDAASGTDAGAMAAGEVSTMRTTSVAAAVMPPELQAIGFLLLLICVPGLCCWFCWIKVLKGGEGHKARSLPEIVDMESVSGVSTRTEPTVSVVESSACQVQSEDIFATRELKDHDAPVQSVGCCTGSRRGESWSEPAARESRTPILPPRKEERQRATERERSAQDLTGDDKSALRYDSRQNARRANGAAGRLAHAEAMEHRASELETEVMQLQRCLQMAQSQEGIGNRKWGRLLFNLPQ
eukprot:s5073_g1.t1